MHSTLFALLLVAALAWLWRDSLRARELAARVSRRACDAEQVQFLDDTVALVSLRPVLERGRLALRRIYQFEFSRRGDDRASGSVMVTGHRLDTVFLSPPPAEAPVRAPGTVVPIDRARGQDS
jgi:hypothetical protein